VRAVRLVWASCLWPDGTVCGGLMLSGAIGDVGLGRRWRSEGDMVGRMQTPAFGIRITWYVHERSVMTLFSEYVRGVE
jgi:hypothetical protein